MPLVNRSALLPFPAASVFGIVEDVEQYPAFLPWCRRVTVLEQQGDELVAELELAARGLHERFTTRNVHFPHERIELHLVSGPFSEFEGAWHFRRLGDDQGCKVELELEFEFSGARGILSAAFSGFFIRTADHLVDAFCQRARDVLDAP